MSYNHPIYNQSINSQYNSERLSHVSNYLGNFQSGVDYKKFDFVYNTGDGLFYYATDDMTYGGGAYISGSGRFTLDPDGPIVGGRDSHYIYDDYSLFDVLGQNLKIGQTVILRGCEQNASGVYNVLDIEKDYISSLSSSDGTLLDALDSKVIISRYNGSIYDSFDGDSVFLTDIDGNILDGESAVNLKSQWEGETLSLDHSDFKNLAEKSKIVDDGDVLGLGKDAFVKNWYESTWFIKSNAGEGSIELNATDFYYAEVANGWIFSPKLGWLYIVPDKKYERVWFFMLGEEPNDNKINQSQGVWLFADRSKIGNNVPGSNSFLYVEPTRNYSIKDSSDIYNSNLDSDDFVLLTDRDGDNLRDTFNFIDSYEALEINSKEYSLLNEKSSFSRRGTYIYSLGKEDFEISSYNDVVGDTGWAYLYKSSNPNYGTIFYNYTNEEYYAFGNEGGNVDFYLGKTTTENQTPKTKPQEDVQERIGDGKVDRIHVQGVSSNVTIDEYEVANDYAISLTAINEDPEGSSSWVTDKFFFDADYGSSVSFETKNVEIRYGNGYYKIFPASINNFNFKANLSFKNRNNREANAIIHFLENHLGQQDKDRNASWLKYSQGISGFRWDGNATFHPYDNIDNQTKTFYCENFSHSLNFEDSNDISLTLTNYNTSILNRGETLFVKTADTYDGNEFYFKNDIAFSDINNQYYYWHSDESVTGKSPVVRNENWTRESGKYSDLNKDYWTREFLWKPSLGLSVGQQPRLQRSTMKSKYIQIYEDGINESLLTLDLSFNNRSDEEARAILHFLENHLGYIPFLFSPPAPYETPQNFICTKWNHIYNYKDNHSIRAQFRQYPFNFEAEKLNNFSTQPLVGGPNITFTKPVTFAHKTEDEDIDQNKPFRKRMYFKNNGGEDLIIQSITMGASSLASFSFLGQENSDVPIIYAQSNSMNKSSYEYNLPLDNSLPFSLSEQKIRLVDDFVPGAHGGQVFHTINSSGNKIKKFLQKNNGDIKNMTDKVNGKLLPSEPCNYFVIEEFIKLNKTNTLPGGSKGYADVIYSASASSSIESFLVDENDNFIDYTNNNGNSSGQIILSKLDGYQDQTFSVESNDRFSPHEGLFRIYLDHE
jgi:phage-related protein